MDNGNEPLACTLTSAELQKRKATALKQFKDSVLEKNELEDGYSYLFDGSDKTLDMLNEFIKAERQCCSFFEFRLRIHGDNSVLLSIVGDNRVKEFITAELGL